MPEEQTQHWGQHLQPGGSAGSLLCITVQQTAGGGAGVLPGLKVIGPLMGSEASAVPSETVPQSQGGGAGTVGSLGVGQELRQPHTTKSAQFLLVCITPSPLGRVFTPSLEGSSVGMEEAEGENGQRAMSSEPVSWLALALPAAQMGDAWSGTQTVSKLSAQAQKKHPQLKLKSCLF